MATATLLDELLSIACGSSDAQEVESRFDQLTKGHLADRESFAAEVTRSIELLRIQAKGMESLALLKSSQRDLERMNLADPINANRERAAGLHGEADDLERVAVAAGVIKQPDRPSSLLGIWSGVEVTEEDIENAKRSLFRNAYDEPV